MRRRVPLEVYIAVLDEVIIAIAIAAIILIFLKGYGIIGWKVFGATIASIAIIGSLLSYVILKTYSKGPQVGKEAIIGLIGEAITEIAREGFVIVEGEIWRARNVGERTIKKGEKVRVVSVNGLTLLVEPEKKG